MFVKELSGHSGCKLSLRKEGEVFFVRKVTDSTDYNARLKLQCAKQRRFTSSAQLAAPAVLDHGFIGDNFYFDMAFIQGKSFAEYFSTINIHDIADYIKILFQSLRFEKNEFSAEAKDIFKEKIDQLRSATTVHEHAQRALDRLDDFDWGLVSKSPCHGDLTLENIIVTPKKEIYLIDFLDSFYNSWMMDIAKLLQDLELGWAFRHRPNDVTRNLKLLVAQESLLGEIQKRDNPEYVLSAIHHLLLLNVVRIYPYTSDEPTLNFLDLAIQKVMNDLEKSDKTLPSIKRKVVNA